MEWKERAWGRKWGRGRQWEEEWDGLMGTGLDRERERGSQRGWSSHSESSWCSLLEVVGGH